MNGGEEKNETDKENSGLKRKLGGRPKALTLLGLRDEDIWNDIVCGLSYKQIARKHGKKTVSENKSGKTFHKGLSERTIARIASRMPQGYEANFDEFSKVPGVEIWRRQMKSNNLEWKRYFVIMKEIWKEVWGKKALEDVDNDDFTLAIEYIHESKIGEAHGKIAIHRFWKSNLLPLVDISNFQNDLKWKRGVRIIPELMSERFFKEIFPSMLQKIRNGVIKVKNGERLCTIELTPRQIDEMILVALLKVTTGIRTGSRQAGRELWGTKVGGSEKETRVTLTNGSFLGMVVNAKKDQRWYIQPTTVPKEVTEKLERHITKYAIGNGEYLIQELTPSPANSFLKGVCQALTITEMRLHDFRKAYLTGMCLAGVRLEYAVDMNVGWRSIETARKHYLMVGGLKKEQEYRKFSRRFFDDEGLHSTQYGLDEKRGNLERMAEILSQNGYEVESPS
jgi:hypothetical protein